MRVLLVQSPNGRMEKPIYPLGLAHLAGALAIQHELAAFDPAFNKAPLRQLYQQVKAFKPEVVCVSLRNIDSGFLVGNFWYYQALAPTLAVIRRAGFSGPIILGGAGFSLFAVQILTEQIQADLGLTFEAEETLPMLLDNLTQPQKVPGTLWREEGEVRFNPPGPPPDLTKLPRANYAIVDPRSYREIPFAVGVQSKRGCALCCTYCTYPFLERKMRLRPETEVGAEVEELARLGMKDFTFVDSEFGKPHNHALALAKTLKEMSNKLPFSVWLSEDECNREMVEELKAAGLHHIEFSPDAYDDTMLTKLGKTVTTSDIDKALETVVKDGQIGAAFNFFVGTPGENISTLWRKVRFRSRIKHLLGEHYMGMGFATIRIYPHTAIFEQLTTMEKYFNPTFDLLHKAKFYYRGFPATLVFRMVLRFRELLGKNRHPLQNLSLEEEA